MNIFLLQVSFRQPTLENEKPQFDAICLVTNYLQTRSTINCLIDIT